MTIEIHRKGGEIETRPKSAGGKLFDLITYGGFAGVGTFLVTLPLAYWQKYTPGRKFYHSAAEALQKVGVSEKTALNAMETTNLMHGGNLMLLPILGMESLRTPIVNGLNRLLNDPTDPESVKDAPKQTFGSVIKGRLLAWSAVFAGFSIAGKIIPEKMQAFENKVGEWTCKILKKPVVAESKAYRYGQLAALDAFATITAASLLYVGSHAFANHAAEKRAHRGASERRREAAAARTTPTLEAPVIEKAPATETPGATISNIQREAAIVSAPEHQLQA